jgi:hypothetical protein
MSSVMAAIADTLLRDLPDGLGVHFQQLDLIRDGVMLVRYSGAELAAASFLDERALNADTPRAQVSWDQATERMAACCERTPAHFIFHVGNCGSTLLSRLMAETGIVGLREPLPLRSLGEIHSLIGAPYNRWSERTFRERLALVLESYHRGTGPRAVKASSFCNDLATAIVGSGPEIRATICCVTPAAYLANILSGANSRISIAALAPMRHRRLGVRVGGGLEPLYEMTMADMVAMSWACEAAALAELAGGPLGDRLRVVDFDAFLEDVPGSLVRLVERIDPSIPAEAIQKAGHSPLLGRYSKALDYEFSPEARRQRLREATATAGDEIHSGLRWLDSAGSRFPAVAAALEQFASRAT